MRNIGAGRTAATVILVGLTAEDIGRVRECLAADAVLPSNSIGFGDALATITRTRPDVVIVGFSQGVEAPLAMAQSLQRDGFKSGLVALADESNAEHILAAMRVGYSEFVVLPDDGQRLRSVVREAAYSPSDDEERGIVIAFCGAKGGVGTSMLASHLAAELAGIHRVLLIDMDFSMGDIASMLDLNPKDNIIGLLPRADRIDERMLTGAVAVHGTKVHVLAQPGELEPAVDLNPDEIYAIIGAGAKGYQYIIIDCGVYLDDAVAMTLNVADVVVLVTEPSVLSVRNAFRRTKVLETLGVERDRIRLVVNRASRSSYVSVADIQTNLGLPVAGTISDDPRTVDQALNEGKLVRDINKKADVARDISHLVAVLTEDVEEDGEPMEKTPSSSSFFFGLFTRGSP